ncbi:MAG: class I SAM-dependent methyltransferase [Syntrophobacteria bacterium]
MRSVKEHYDDFLAEHYSWMFGDFDAKVQENRNFFELIGFEPGANGKALDLGCGPGFQSIALAELGFRVLSVDICETLLAELRNRKADLDIDVVKGDILDYTVYAQAGPFEVAVCMGDTLTHLRKPREVSALFANIYSILEEGGRLALTFRDLTTELKGTDRIVPVKCDDDKLMATFLEYGKKYVNVHDMIFVKGEAGWELKKSVYSKLRISSHEIIGFLEHLGFRIKSSDVEKALSSIVAKK